MCFGKDDWICLEEEVYASIEKLRRKMSDTDTVSPLVTYTHVGRDCDQHGFLEQDFEWFGKDILYARAKGSGEIFLLQRRKVTLVASLLALALCELDKKDGSTNVTSSDCGRRT